jgi:hypothetical protein
MSPNAIDGSAMVKYKLAMCSANLAQFTPQAYLNVPPWIEYHSLYGVDQFVMYVRAHRRNDFLKLLKPWLQRGLVSLIMVDDDANYVAQDMHDYTQIKAFKWLDNSPDTSTDDGIMINDCIYRLRRKADWATPQNDVDEYLVPLMDPNPSMPLSTMLVAGLKVENLMNNSSDEISQLRRMQRQIPIPDSGINPPDFSQPLKTLPQVLEPYLQSDNYSSVSARMLLYEVSVKPEAQIALWSKHRQDEWAERCEKSIVRPELIDVNWIHWPTNAKRGIAASIENVLRVNHYRLTNRTLTNFPAEITDNITNVTDIDFIPEAHGIHSSVCLAFGLQNDCRPVQWLPEGMNVSEAGWQSETHANVANFDSHGSDFVTDSRSPAKVVFSGAMSVSATGVFGILVLMAM